MNQHLLIKQPHESMNFSKHLTHFTALFAIVLLAGIFQPALCDGTGLATDARDHGTSIRLAGRGRDSLADGSQKLMTKGALNEIFGPDVHELLTRNEVQDANNAKRFAATVTKGAIL